MTPGEVTTRLRRHHALLVDSAESKRVAGEFDVDTERMVLVLGRDVVTGLTRSVEVRKRDLPPPDEPTLAVDRG
ncbi:MAG: hypothetical protein KJ698_13905 [Actinobacteria bacterium]|nr:hypothetical protein [Actinomycetota bacterium]MBU1493116.1 hypothetical protein [Actinomycetota bacterium]MBU1865969.1 hypothetical protein [Actinomycetota bacterium]